MRKNLLKGRGWNPEVSEALNHFLKEYGIGGASYTGTDYVVFDFDNTCSIFDVEDQLMLHQLLTMSFKLTPDEIYSVFMTSLPEQFIPMVQDIADAYKKLWDAYGPFDTTGVSRHVQARLRRDDNWLEFAAKARTLYQLLPPVIGNVSYCSWCLYWFSHMTPSEVYQLAMRSHQKYKKLPTRYLSLESLDIPSHAGRVSGRWPLGISVTREVKNLWRALKKAGIDIWICSASGLPQICAAVDAFGLHDCCKGVLAMTIARDTDNTYFPEYDYNAPGALALPNGVWESGVYATKARTQAAGKPAAIMNAIAPLYGGKGPLAGFMDSEGDIEFCTELDSMRLVLCFFRGFTGRMEELIYKKARAPQHGPTYYYLQSRSEKGMRHLIPR